MTYGWMLLVVAVVGAAIFSIVQGQNIDSISGFTGSDVIVDDAGLTSEDNLDMILRNGAANQIDINKVTVSNGEREAYFLRGESISVGNQKSVTVNGITEGDGSNSLDVTINYDSSGLTDLETSGTISGALDLKAGKPVGLDAPGSGGAWTWVDGNSQFETDSVSQEGFYVMKYEVRDDGGALSKPEGQPNTSIAFDDAFNECQALSSSNYDISMITNAQWMTIARQVESQEENWVNGKFGSTYYSNNEGLVGGWAESDEWDNTQAAPNSKRSNLYNIGADQGGSSGDDKHRRTYVLKSGGIIWDLTGNVHEFVDVNGDGSPLADGDIKDAGASTGFINNSEDYLNSWGFNDDASSYKFELGSSDDSYGKAQQLGYFSDSDSSNRVMRKGGVWNLEFQAGPYTADTGLNNTETQSGTGYRCSAVPT